MYMGLDIKRFVFHEEAFSRIFVNLLTRKNVTNFLVFKGFHELIFTNGTTAMIIL